MRRRDQQGASLIIVLALVLFLGIMVPSILKLTATGSRASRPVHVDRRELYAASSAIDAAVQVGRRDADLGVPGGPCPQQIVTIDGLEVTVGCAHHLPPDDGCRYLDRFVTFTADVRKPGESAVLATTAAEVVYRYNFDVEPDVEIRQFTPGGSAPVTTTPLPPCATTTTTTSTTTPPVSTTTTTTTTTTIPSTSTTTTTTTTPPDPTTVVFSLWGSPTRENVNGGKWRAVAPMEIFDGNGTRLENAVVTVHVEYLEDGVWKNDGNLNGTSTVTGAVTFHSPSHKTDITQIRFTVLSVTTTPARTWNSAANPLTVTRSV